MLSFPTPFLFIIYLGGGGLESKTNVIVFLVSSAINPRMSPTFNNFRDPSLLMLKTFISSSNNPDTYKFLYRDDDNFSKVTVLQ